jgi:transposase-like protein
LKELTNNEIQITDSYVTNLMLEYRAKLSNVNIELQKEVKNTDVLNLDETCIKLNGKQITLQGFANRNTTYLQPARKKCDEKIYTFLNDYNN